MARYRENLQYSITTLTYDYLGIKTMIPIVDKVPDKAQHVHDGHGSQIDDNKNTSVDELHVEVTRDGVSSLNKELLKIRKLLKDPRQKMMKSINILILS